MAKRINLEELESIIKTAKEIDAKIGELQDLIFDEMNDEYTQVYENDRKIYEFSSDDYYEAACASEQFYWIFDDLKKGLRNICKNAEQDSVQNEICRLLELLGE